MVSMFLLRLSGQRPYNLGKIETSPLPFPADLSLEAKSRDYNCGSPCQVISLLVTLKSLFPHSRLSPSTRCWFSAQPQKYSVYVLCTCHTSYAVCTSLKHFAASHSTLGADASVFVCHSRCWACPRAVSVTCCPGQSHGAS